jgi:hypothetical protein
MSANASEQEKLPYLFQKIAADADPDVSEEELSAHLPQLTEKHFDNMR